MPDTILFLDIDGCLTRGKFARYDLAALQTLEQLVQQSPTEVVLCTGRSLSYIETRWHKSSASAATPSLTTALCSTTISTTTLSPRRK